MTVLNRVETYTDHAIGQIQKDKKHTTSAASAAGCVSEKFGHMGKHTATSIISSVSMVGNR